MAVLAALVLACGGIAAASTHSRLLTPMATAHRIFIRNARRMSTTAPNIPPAGAATRTGLPIAQTPTPLAAGINRGLEILRRTALPYGDGPNAAGVATPAPQHVQFIFNNTPRLADAARIANKEQQAAERRKRTEAQLPPSWHVERVVRTLCQNDATGDEMLYVLNYMHVYGFHLPRTVSVGLHTLVKHGKAADAIAVFDRLRTVMASLDTDMDAANNAGAGHVGLESAHQQDQPKPGVQRANAGQQHLERTGTPASSAGTSLVESAYACVVGAAIMMDDVGKCMEYIQEMEMRGITPRARILIPVMAAMLTLNMQAEAWDVYGRFKQHKIPLENDAFAILLEGMAATTSPKFRAKSAEIFADMRLTGGPYSDDVVEAARLYFESQRIIEGIPWRIAKVDVDANQSGVCAGCGHSLEQLTLSAEKRDQLMEAIRTMLRDADQLEEFKNFHRWLKAHGPFEVVLDGLNVGHLDHMAFSPTRFSQILNHFVGLGYRVMGLLRNTNRSAFHKQLDDRVYYAASGRADDLYWLYAALDSNLGAIVVTNDMMRDHARMLGENLRHDFKRWQRAHQVKISMAPGKAPVVESPSTVDPVLQGTAKSWHVPGESNWLCVTQH
eukprot:Opistho-2@66118